MQQNKSSIKQKLISICKKYLKNRDIDDIIIVGSFLRSKEKVTDIDIYIVLNKENPKLIKEFYNISKEKGIPTHINKTKFSHLLGDILVWKTILHEGFSIKENKFISEVLGMRPFVLINFDLLKLNKTKKQSFSHALYGTGGRESFLKSINGKKVGKSAIAIPIENIDKIREFLDNWKVDYNISRIWM